MKLVNKKQSLYGPIYTFMLIELEGFKAYIETHLKTNFIQTFKSVANIHFFFARRPAGSLYLCINYRNFNNLTIKNQYLFPPIRQSQDKLSWAKRFI